MITNLRKSIKFYVFLLFATEKMARSQSAALRQMDTQLSEMKKICFVNLTYVTRTCFLSACHLRFCFFDSCLLFNSQTACDSSISKSHDRLTHTACSHTVIIDQRCQTLLYKEQKETNLDIFINLRNRYLKVSRIYKNTKYIKNSLLIFMDIR